MVRRGRGKKHSTSQGAKSYSLRSGLNNEGASSINEVDIEQTTVTPATGPPIVDGGDITHVTNTEMNDPTVVHVEANEDENQVEANDDHADSTQGRDAPRKLLGKNLETKLLDDIYRELSLKCTIEPPLVPLCRLVQHEAIRIITSSLNDLRESFDDPGYSPLVCTPFIVSLKRAGKQEYIRVTDVDRTIWGPIWTAKSQAFDDTLPDEWKDLRGRKFIVWDGNHRVKAWMSKICESYSNEPARHICVKCQFLDVSDARKEGELLLALRATNQIVVTHISPTYAHELFLFKKLGMCNKESLLHQLSDEDKKWVEVELQAEQKITTQGWYNVPAVILALLVWKKEVKSLKLKLVEAIDKKGLSDAAFEEEKRKVENSVEKQFQSRAYKYLTVANPANGDGFFRLIWNYDWSPSNRSGPLSKDKLQIIAVAKIYAQRKQEVLHDLITIDMKDTKYLDRYKDAPRLRRYLDKEIYWNFLLQEAEVILEDLRGHGVHIDFCDQSIDFFHECREAHVDQAFSDLWCLMKTSATKSNSLELHHSAMRLVYRLAKNACKDGSIKPREIQEWSNPKSTKCMYTARFWELEISHWEMNRCPWWLDYPLDVIPPSEEEDFSLFQAMAIQSQDDNHQESSSMGIQDSAKEPEGSATKRKAGSLGLSSHAKHGKIASRLDFDMGKKSSHARSKRSSGMKHCTHVEVMMADVLTLMDDPRNEKIESWLAKINAKTLSHYGAPCREVVNVVWADFPTGLRVSKASPNDCPSWNVWQRKLSIAASEVAHAFVANEGWYITCGLTEHFPLVCTHAMKKGFTLHRTLHLIMDCGYIRDENEEVIDLAIGLFYHKDYDVPPIHRDVGETIDPNCFDKGRSIVLEILPDGVHYTTTLTHDIIRGGAERHSKFWRWLLLTFTEKCDSVLDLFCGVGGLGRESIALQRHCLCIDNDEALFDTVLQDVHCVPTDI